MNKTILITGASSGIGKETAKLFQSKGWNVIATMRNPENETELKMVRQFNTNVIGLLDVTKTVLPHFRQNKKGIIINISSIGGKMTFPLGSLYHGTKFAVEGISESLSYEVEQFGGQVKIVEPGMIATDFGGRSFDFSNDEKMAEYQNIVSALMTALPVMAENASPASVVAKVIFEAATDGKNQLRYIAGEDAKILISNRKQYDDATFTGDIKSQFGL